MEDQKTHCGFHLQAVSQAFWTPARSCLPFNSVLSLLLLKLLSLPTPNIQPITQPAVLLVAGFSFQQLRENSEGQELPLPETPSLTVDPEQLSSMHLQTWPLSLFHLSKDLGSEFDSSLSFIFSY